GKHPPPNQTSHYESRLVRSSSWCSTFPGEASRCSLGGSSTSSTNGGAGKHRRPNQSTTLSRLQPQTHRVDAIPQPGRWWAVGEDVAEVGVAAGTEHFGAVHAVTVVLGGGDGIVVHRRVVAGPATAGIELGVGIEQRCIAAYAVVLTRFTLEVILAGKWPFGTLESAYLILGVVQLVAPGVIRLDY